MARSAVGDPQARLEPVDAERTSIQYWRRWFGEQVRLELDRRKRRLGVLSFDDLLQRVADALAAGGSDARERMRQRWSLVLVDEFQDTDPVQWEVLRRAFVGHATVVLVGDPKQAVYAFRGGDVVTYLAAAARSAETRATLSRNWRSDADLVGALGVLWDDVELGDPEIVIRPVTAAHQHGDLRAHRSWRRCGCASCGASRSADGSTPPIDAVRAHVAKDLAADLVQAAQVRGQLRRCAAGCARRGRPGRHQPAGDDCPRRPADAEHSCCGRRTRQCLRHRRPATPGSRLLEALEQPGRVPLVRAAALTPFLGWTAAELDARGEAGTDELSGVIRDGPALLADRGVAAVLEAATADRGLWAKVLSRPDGPRLLTDIRHIGQALQAAAIRDRLGPAALLEWLRRRRSGEHHRAVGRSRPQAGQRRGGGTDRHPPRQQGAGVRGRLFAVRVRPLGAQGRSAAPARRRRSPAARHRRTRVAWLPHAAAAGGRRSCRAKRCGCSTSV